MSLFTTAQREQLLRNGANPDQDHAPVARLHLMFAKVSWLISELDPENQDMAFGLCDLGMGFPELGYIYLPEILELQDDPRFRVLCDQSFTGAFPMSVYARAARFHSEIVTEPATVRQFATKPGV
jgi:hypothetical protein